MKRNDRDLVVRLKAKDERAFEKLVKRYEKRIYMIAYNILRNEEDAYDATQNVFLKVYKYIDNFRETASLYTWIYKIAYHVSIDIYRKRKKGSSVEYSEFIKSEGVTAHDLHHKVADPSAFVENNELTKTIESALEKISESHRTVIVLREIEGLSYAEIAEILDVSKGTVMSRLHHARLNLQKYLKKHL